MGFKSTFFLLPSFIFFIFLASSVYISARPISNISVNNLNTSIGCDEGNIGEGNEFNVKGKCNTCTLSGWTETFCGVMWRHKRL